MSDDNGAVLSGLLTKRTLVAVSHAIEQAGLAPAVDGPMVFMAMFQRLDYFKREWDVYSRLAQRGVATVVGFVEDFQPAVPEGVIPVVLRDGEPLAREWSAMMLTPRAGASLVAIDQEQVAPGEPTLEAGRLFDGRWAFRRDLAAAEVQRLRTAFADRIPAWTAGAIDSVLERTRSVAPDAAEVRTEASMRLLTVEMERARRRNTALRQKIDDLAGNDRDKASRLFTEHYLNKWVAGAAAGAHGTLPVALVLLRVANVGDMGERLGVRAAADALSGIVAALVDPLRDIDRAVRLSDDEFLLVLPAVDGESADALARATVRRIEALEGQYPFVPLPTTASVMVTRERPLPLHALREGAVAAPRQRATI